MKNLIVFLAIFFLISCKKNEVNPYYDLSTNLPWDCNTRSVEFSNVRKYYTYTSDGKIKREFHYVDGSNSDLEYIYYSDSIVVKKTIDDKVSNDKESIILNDDGLMIQRFLYTKDELNNIHTDTQNYEYNDAGYLIKIRNKSSVKSPEGVVITKESEVLREIKNGNLVSVNSSGKITRYVYYDTLNLQANLYPFSGTASKNLLKYEIFNNDTIKYFYELRDKYPVKMTAISVSDTSIYEYSYDCK